MPVLQQAPDALPPFTVTFDGPMRRGRFVLRAPDQGEAELEAERMMRDDEYVVSVDWGDRT